MSGALPDLELLPPGTVCALCGDEMRISFCATCYEREMQALEDLRAEQERLVRRDLDEAKRRARTWKLDRLVQQ